MTTTDKVCVPQELKLFPQQLECANKAYSILECNHGYIDTSQMGTGKMFLTLWLCKQLNMKLFIVCADSMVNCWKYYTEMYGVEIIFIISYRNLIHIKLNNPYLIKHDKKRIFETTNKYYELINEK